MLSTNDIRNKAYDYILRSGAAGLTDQELTLLLGLDSYRVRDRRLELLRKHRIVTAPFRRRTGESRGSRVWLSTKVVNSLNRRLAISY